MFDQGEYLKYGTEEYINRKFIKNNNSSEMNEYIKQVTQSNNNYDMEIENIRLKNLVEFLKKENEKISKAKELLEEYNYVLKQKNNEIEELRKNNQILNEDIQKVPKFVRILFIK